jgi:GNAT superfamily N-acetyltransferase
MQITIRKAVATDAPAIHQLISELANYEQAGHELSIDANQLVTDGFGSQPLFEVLLAEHKSEILGMALWFYAYSTWKGKCVYLEDIVVKHSHRRKGIGKQLFDALISRAAEVGAKRLMWQVLDWNEPAINFYKKYNAEISNQWLNVRLVKEQIQQLSSK